MGSNFARCSVPIRTRLDLPPRGTAPSWPVRRPQVLGHDAFMAQRYSRLVERRAGPDHSYRELHVRRIEPLADLGQHFPPPRQRLTQQATASVVEQVE